MLSPTFTLVLPADTRWLTVAELPGLLAEAVQPSTSQPATISAIYRVPLLNGRPINRFDALSPADSELLHGIWGIQPEALLGTSADQWERYLQSFRSADQRPSDWEPSVRIQGGARQHALLNVIARQQHQQRVDQAIVAGQLITLDPVSYLPSTRYEATARANLIISADEFSRYAATLGIEVTSQPSMKRAQSDPERSSLEGSPSDLIAASSEGSTEQDVMRSSGSVRASACDLPPATAGEIIAAFKIRGHDSENNKVWKRMMRDAKRTAWLRDARVMTGSNSRASLWRPELIAAGISIGADVVGQGEGRAAPLLSSALRSQQAFARRSIACAASLAAAKALAAVFAVGNPLRCRIHFA